MNKSDIKEFKRIAQKIKRGSKLTADERKMYAAYIESREGRRGRPPVALPDENAEQKATENPAPPSPAPASVQQIEIPPIDVSTAPMPTVSSEGVAGATGSAPSVAPATPSPVSPPTPNAEHEAACEMVRLGYQTAFMDVVNPYLQKRGQPGVPEALVVAGALAAKALAFQFLPKSVDPVTMNAIAAGAPVGVAALQYFSSEEKKEDKKENVVFERPRQEPKAEEPPKPNGTVSTAAPVQRPAPAQNPMAALGFGLAT